MVTEDQILAIAKQINVNVHPSSIYLFGSYAYGTPHENSDIDFMVVKKKIIDKRRELVDLKMALDVGDVSVDVIMVSEEELNLRHKEGWSFFKDVLGKGRRLNV